MNTFTDWIYTEVVYALGWTIVHSLWQGLAIVALLSVLLYLFRRQTANFRYWLSLWALVVLGLSTLGTFLYHYQPTESEAFTYIIGDLDFTSEELAEVENTSSYLTDGNQAGSVLGNHPNGLLPLVERYLPALVALWLLGLVCFASRTLIEYVYLQRLRVQSSAITAPNWQRLLDLTAVEMDVRHPVALRQSTRITTPMVLGFLKPVILFPVALVNGLTGDQVAGILAHELAHVKRQDYLVNLLISGLEVMLFYHPAVWWVTARIKAERENSCDDIAVAVTGDAVTFVKTLAHLENHRVREQSLALALTGKNGSVLGRIQRLLHQSPTRPAPIKAFLSVTCLAVCVGLFAFQVPNTPAVLADDPSELTALVLAPDEPEVGLEEPLADVVPTPPAAANAVIALPASATTPNRDSVPADLRALEEEMRTLEKEMRNQEREIEQQAQQLRKEMLEKEKALQASGYAMKKKRLELRSKEREIENAMDLKQHEIEMAHSELRSKALELEQQAAELDRQAEAWAEKEASATVEELRKASADFQAQRNDLLRKHHELEKEQLELEKAAHLQRMDMQKKAQALEKESYLLENEMNSMEQEENFKIQEIHQKMEALTHEQMLLHRVLEQKQQALEARYDQMVDELEK